MLCGVCGDGGNWMEAEACCPNESAGGDAAEAEELRSEQDERVPKPVADVKGPTQWERMTHDITHIPYRPWCRFCVEGRGKSRYHSRHLEDRSNEKPVVSMDFASLGPRETIVYEGEETPEMAHAQLVPFLGLKDRVTKALASISIPTKSASDTYARDECLRHLEEWGRAEIVMRCDKEGAIKDLRRSIVEARVHGTAVEDCPRDEHQANGDIENGIGMIGGQIRTMRAALRYKLGVDVDHRTPVTRFLVDYAGALITRFAVGEDGKTPYERLKGRRFKR